MYVYIGEVGNAGGVLTFIYRRYLTVRRTNPNCTDGKLYMPTELVDRSSSSRNVSDYRRHGNSFKREYIGELNTTWR